MTKQPPKKENYINTFDELPLRAFNPKELNDLKQSGESVQQLAKPFIGLVRHLCGNDADIALDWVLNWLALPLQKPGKKLDTSLLVHGYVQGAGKSLFFDRIMARIYGDYLLTLGQGQLDSQYNDWVEGKLFVTFEEIFQGNDKWGQMGRVKHLITGDTTYINKKFMSGWKADNFVNAVFLSNDMKPLSLEETDRRIMVLHPEGILPKDIQESISQALQDKDSKAIRAFLTYLLTKDLGDFDAHTKPLMTGAKETLIDLSRSSWEKFYNDWQRGYLDAPYMTCLSDDLFNFYKAWCHKAGERHTSATKFLTYIGRREDKSRAWYRYTSDLTWASHTPKERTETKRQGTMIVVNLPQTEQPLMDWYGQCIQEFRSQVFKYMQSVSQKVV